MSLHGRGLPSARLLLLILLQLALAACATAPATGKRIFTGGMTLGVEAEVGRSLDQELQRKPGGLYRDARLESYFRTVGARIAAVADTPHPLRFALLDQSRIYAGAVPGGYIYLSRGLLAYLWDEAELAAVLAHEAAHIAARHGAERFGARVVRGEASPAAAELSREQEEEADRLALTYLARAGYDPNALADSLAHIGAVEALLATVFSNPAFIEADPLDDHPLTADRVETLRRDLAGAPPVVSPDAPVGGRRERERFLATLAGLPFGGSPEEGIFLKGRFLRPAEGVAFRLASRWGIEPQPGLLLASRGPRTALRLDSLEDEPERTPASYLRRDWPGNPRLHGRIEERRINGLEAAVTEGRLKTAEPGEKDLFSLYAAIRTGGRLHRFFALVPDEPALRAEVLAMLMSFTPLGPEERKVSVPRLSLHQVAPGETVASLAGAIPLPGNLEPDLRQRIFRLLNGLPEGGEVESGRLVKLVATP